MDESGEDDGGDSVGEGTRRKGSPGEDEDWDAERESGESPKTDPTKILSDSILGSFKSSDREEFWTERFEFSDDVARLTRLLSLRVERDFEESSQFRSTRSVEPVEDFRGWDAIELERKGDSRDRSSSTSDGLNVESCCSSNVASDGLGGDDLLVVDESGES